MHGMLQTCVHLTLVVIPICFAHDHLSIRQVLIELAPSYFRYMEATTSKPTVLAKLLGFYTVEIKNLENGTTQAKADLLVMENLFYDQKVVKTFDLKGIQGRKVKAATSGNTASQSSRTLFDGEWIEGMLLMMK
jgi:1-phosphatidylinositol-3-phosphate 5-kinase